MRLFSFPAFPVPLDFPHIPAPPHPSPPRASPCSTVDRLSRTRPSSPPPRPPCETPPSSPSTRPRPPVRSGRTTRSASPSSASAAAAGATSAASPASTTARSSPSATATQAASATAMKAVAKKTGKEPEVRAGHPQGARRQVDRHRLDRHAEPLARPGGHLGHAGRQGRLRREAGQPQRQRRPAHRRGGPQVQHASARPARRAAATPGMREADRVRPRRQDRQGEARPRPLLQAARRASARWTASSRSRRPSTTTCGAARPRSCPLQRKKLHYDWHWIWDYGNGDLGNQGIHEMDKARWGLGKNELPQVGRQRRRPLRLRRRRRDGQHAGLPSSTTATRELIFEVRGLPTDSPYPARGRQARATSSATSGTATKGYVVCPSYDSGVAFDPDGKEVAEVQRRRRRLHFGNFVKAVRSRQARGPERRHRRRAPVRRPVPPGNISYRLGDGDAVRRGRQGDRRRARTPTRPWPG